ncbi:MAG TPA: MFS transporter, partial [Miltoncostaeaceae bacterium]|nr:MFS transporter [Miltoncostaeaceae bacterium]
AQGAAAGLVWTAGMACIADVYPRDQLGLRMGLAETAGGATGLLGPVLGGLLIEIFGVEEAFLFIAIIPAVAIVPALFMPETRHADTQPPPPLTRSLAILMRVPRAWVAAVSLGLFAAALALLEPLLPLDLADRLGLGSLAVGMVFGAGLAAYYLAMPFAGRWSDRHGRRAPLVVGALIMAASLPFVSVGPAWLVAAAFAVAGVGMACVSAPSGPLMVEAVDETELAGNYGVSGAVLTALFAIGYAIGPLMGAGASLVLPFPATMTIAAGLALIAGIWTARLLPRRT